MTRNDLVDSSGWNVTLERPEKMILPRFVRWEELLSRFFFLCRCYFSNHSAFHKLFEQKISALHYYLQRIKEGHLNYHIHDDSKDELGDLTNNLQAMIDEINRLIREDYQTKIELKKTQFKALQAQINPHFLYNCLSLINNKALMNDRPEISQMSQLLSVFTVQH